MYIKYITFTENARRNSFSFEFKRKIAYSYSTCLSSASVLVKVSERAVLISNCNLRLLISEFHNQLVRQIHHFYQRRAISVSNCILSFFI